MSSRDEILDRIRRNQPAPQPLPHVPAFDRDTPPLIEVFEAALTRMGGKFVTPPVGSDLGGLVRTLFPDAKAICSATPEVTGDFSLDAVRGPAELDVVDVGVVRAEFGVAETGSVWLSEVELGEPALGFLSQHLVVLLDPRQIVPNLHHAYADPRRFEPRYSVFMTGPSATADIEGVLIHGAQGIRTLTVIPREAC